jgi:hypothetical protein
MASGSTSITAVPYFYDKQFRRYIQQFIRLFAGFQFVVSYTSDGEPVYQTVPVRYGDISRMAAHIQKQNSENMLNTVPFISCYVSGLGLDAAHRTYQQFEEKLPVIEKKYDESTSSYSNEAGNTYTVTRHQPVPYKLSMQVDLWTSNTEQKLQLLEQILVLFNPSLNIHTTNNPLDWSSLSYVELVNTQWSSRSLPQGVDDVIDIASLTFDMPILINPPAKVLRNTLIHTIVANIHDVETGVAESIRNGNSFVPLFTSYKVITLENYKTRFTVSSAGVATAQILNRQGGTTDSNGDPLTWATVFTSFGEFRNDISQLRLKQTDDPSDVTNDIVGTLASHPTDANLLVVTLDTDTIPANTQNAINRIVDPELNFPGDTVLPSAANGQRYLILNSVPEGSAWGGIAADANDIIEYNAGSWSVTFNASNNLEATHYTTNLHTLDKLKWNGTAWINAYEGTYNPGFWRIYL